jgi:hypothetical protein
MTQAALRRGGALVCSSVVAVGDHAYFFRAQMWAVQRGVQQRGCNTPTACPCDPVLLPLPCREVANLHSFPPAPACTFPASVTRRQRYQLLGNSLSVEVVADLLTFLLRPAGSTAARSSAQGQSLEQAATAGAGAAVDAAAGSDPAAG